ncbi:UNVERIFIED_ORG: hypothetical protein ABIB52_004511 [Arthrobacter sp. UYCu721]
MGMVAGFGRTLRPFLSRLFNQQLMQSHARRWAHQNAREGASHFSCGSIGSRAWPSTRSKGHTGSWKDNRIRLDIKAGSRLINAHSESILDKPSFRRAAVKRRALVPGEGYDEWQKTEDGKMIPDYLYSAKDDVPAFAGLYEFWLDPFRGCHSDSSCSRSVRPGRGPGG